MADEDDRTMFLGWDVGGTTCGAIVGTGSGEIVHRRQWPAEAAAGPDAMLKDFFDNARALLAETPGIEEVGVSIGGPMNPLTGTILSPPHLPGWDNIPLAEILKRELDLDPVVEHDAVACLQAEWLWGAARGTTHAIYITCGTGCGAGILLDGRIVRGPTGQTPEIGHARMADDGPEMFGKRGSVESFCAGEGIGKLAPFLFPERFKTPTDARTLHDLAEGGDKQARAVLEESARRTGQLCSLLAEIFSPEAVVLGSLARYFDDWWLQIVREEFTRETLPMNGGHTRIVPAELGDRLQDLSSIAPCVARSRACE